MKKKALVIRHLPFEDLGAWGEALSAAGYEWHYLEAGLDDFSAIDPLAADLAIILGGPIGIHQEVDYPWLTTEIDLARARIEAGRPTLGICLGAQVMARALGAKVIADEPPEIGWSTLELTDAGRVSVMRHLEDIPVLHWHGDRFELPANAERLASTGSCPNQAFRLGTNVLALQCHPEVRWPDLEAWLIGNTRSLTANNLSVTNLREASKQYAPALVPAARRLIDEWLAGLQPGY